MLSSTVCSRSLASLIVLLLSLGLCGCGSGSSSGSNAVVAPTTPTVAAGTNYRGDGSSGVQGTVLSIPSTPTGTNMPPVAGCTIILETTTGLEITHVTTDSNGHYSVPLIPGFYIVIPQPVSSTKVPIVSSLNVTVLNGVYEEADFSYYDPTK